MHHMRTEGIRQGELDTSSLVAAAMLPSWLMSTEQILQVLILERDKLDRAIEALAEPVTGRSTLAPNLLPAARAKASTGAPRKNKRNRRG
jgi:hypothetical protein